MKALEMLQDISTRLASYNIEDAGHEAELILRQVLNVDATALYRDNPEVTTEQGERISETISRRGGREPLQYIEGRTEFLGLVIEVGRGVLIPRPETELMAEMAIETINGQRSTVNSQRIFLDLCTGSGCLALSLAKHFPDSTVYGVDISEGALAYAKKNAALNNIVNVKFLKGHLCSPLGQNMRFDFIISNPPYIRRADIYSLQPEIREWEPLNALDGGTDGLDFYRELVPEARKYLRDGGVIMFEVGHDQADQVAALLKEYNYGQIKKRRDYSDIRRVVSAEWTR